MRVTADTMPAVKALLFDIDKTLTTLQKEITPFTEKIIKELVAQNRFTLGVCSGRAPVLAQEVLSLFSQESYHILNGGATLMRGSAQIIWEQVLPSNLVKEIASQAEQLGAEYEFQSQGKVYVSARKYARKSDGVYSTTNLTDWSTPLLCVQWVNPAVKELVSKFEGIEVKEMISQVNGPYFDITPEGVNKASGLQRWSQLTGIPLNQVAGFGDGLNDVEFLQTVGWAVAMGNAVSELKREANIVIGHANQNGLARYLQTNFLQDK